MTLQQVKLAIEYHTMILEGLKEQAQLMEGKEITVDAEIPAKGFTAPRTRYILNYDGFAFPRRSKENPYWDYELGAFIVREFKNVVDTQVGKGIPINMTLPSGESFVIPVSELIDPPKTGDVMTSKATGKPFQHCYFYYPEEFVPDHVRQATGK